MKTHVKKEQKKYPYHRIKHNIFAQITAYERRKQKKLNNYAIIDEKGEIVDKFRLNNTAIIEMRRIQRSFPGSLRVCKLDESGKPGVVIA